MWRNTYSHARESGLSILMYTVWWQLSSSTCCTGWIVNHLILNKSVNQQMLWTHKTTICKCKKSCNKLNTWNVTQQTLEHGVLTKFPQFCGSIYVYLILTLRHLTKENEADKSHREATKRKWLSRNNYCECGREKRRDGSSYHNPSFWEVIIIPLFSSLFATLITSTLCCPKHQHCTLQYASGIFYSPPF